MIAFLSPEWIAEYDRLLRGAGAPPTVSPLTIEQRVTDGETVVAWQLILDTDGAQVEANPAESAAAAVVFSQTRATATAIAQRTSTAHEAFMVGDLRVSGDVAALTANTALTKWLDAALADLYSVTDFGAPS